MKKYHFLLLVCLALLHYGAEPALAHAVPVFTEPAANAVLATAPAEVTIRFNEPVVPELSQISVLAQAGQALAVGQAQVVDSDGRTLVVVLPPVAEGVYLVSWQALSAVDGHTTSGSFSFGVGSAEITAASVEQSEVIVTAELSPLSAATRWLTLTGIALVLALFVFRLFVWNPILKDMDLEAEEEQLDLRQAHTTLKVGVAGLALIGIGLVLILISQSQRYDLWQFDTFQTWLDTRFGSVWLARFFLTLAAAFNLVSLFARLRDGRKALHGWEWWAGLVFAIGFALTSSLISHSAALTRDSWQAAAVDLAHTLAAAIWVGGLLYLALALWQARHLTPDSRTWLTLSLLLNFSALAAMAVGVLLVSGGYLAWKHVGSWTALVGTTYGLTLLVKIVLALPAFGIAAVNLLVIKPRLNDAYEREASEATLTLMRRFGRLARLEAFFALLVLAAAGILSDLQRGADAPLLSDAPGKMVTTQMADDVDVQLTIEPALVGVNSFDVYLTDPNGNPVTDATEVSLRYTFLDQSIGAAEGAAVSTGNGHYRLEGSYISLIGAWQVEVAVRRPGAFDTFAPFRLEAGLGGNIRPLDTSSRPLERMAKFLTLAGGAITGAFMVLFAVGWGFLAARAARSEWGLTFMLLISILVFWLGATQLFNFFTNEYTPTKFLTNPVLPDAASVASGESLFQEHCVVCHGPAGHGDGPAAVTLSPPPVDFTSGHTAIHPDGDLYYWIRNGIENSAMPAFDDQLSNEETWHLVNYVRRLSVQSASIVQ